jgi:F0F1-type ATP synthase assembly protein I
LKTTGRTESGRLTDAFARLVPQTAPVDPTDVDRNDPERAARLELTNGFGNALAKAFELVATPAVFALLGWLLDRWLGTEPVFMLTFALVVFGYEVWKLFLGYGAAMDEHEARLMGKHPDRSGDA